MKNFTFFFNLTAGSFWNHQVISPNYKQGTYIEQQTTSLTEPKYTHTAAGQSLNPMSIFAMMHVISQTSSCSLKFWETKSLKDDQQRCWDNFNVVKPQRQQLTSDFQLLFSLQLVAKWDLKMKRRNPQQGHANELDSTAQGQRSILQKTQL